MTQVKMCGLSREVDIATVNGIKPNFIGFIFAPKSKRYVTSERAKALKSLLDPNIRAVGVFVNESIESVASLLAEGVIDVAQLHGSEDEDYILQLRQLTTKPIWQAFRIQTAEDVETALESSADMILLDSGGGSGKTLDWNLLKGITRPYLLAGGLSPNNVADAIGQLHPYGVDVSSGIETEGWKDEKKMKEFINIIQLTEDETI